MVPNSAIIMHAMSNTDTVKLRESKVRRSSSG